ncbi:type I glutamate--ammonia ligase [candidate division KSB1 bacterium]|nr:type I glutamate--ammonia ligase [candidate division KSB1 bacterium]
MDKAQKHKVLEFAKKNKVRFIRFWFCDILGFLKSFAITFDEFETALDEGMGFDGSSIEGFARIDESDMIAMPDVDTFQLLPWKTADNTVVARVFCDIYTPEGKPYEGDPRWVLKKNLERMKQMGFDHFYVGPELEYFYFQSSTGSPEVLDHGGYFDLTPLDVAGDLRKETVLMLEDMGIKVEYSHHEVGHSQHEIDLRYTDALNMADYAMTYRLLVKEIAIKHGVYATFMPKPLFGQNGSGMHTHQSLFINGKNAFFSTTDERNLSDTAKKYIAGLLRHAHEFTVVTNQWVNSYKRLVPGYEAPVYLSWATKNRSDLIRVPGYKPGKEEATRVEFRSPDPACNPYLAFAVMLAAGLDGIENNYELVQPVERNVYTMTEKEREEMGIGSLPKDLHEATQIAKKSDWLRNTLGDHVYFKLIENKEIEWETYRSQVTSFELERYLPVL